MDINWIQTYCFCIGPKTTLRETTDIFIYTCIYTCTCASKMKSFSKDTRYAIIVVASLLMLVGIIGNGLIICAFLKSKKLRIRINIFIVMLAIVDLLIISYLLPFNIYIVETGTDLPPLLCTVNGNVAPILFMTSIQYIMLISVSRYVKICHSNKFDSIFSTTNIIVMTTGSFLLTVCFLLPLFHDIEQNFVLDRSLQMCIFNRFGNSTYSTIAILLGLFFPISTTSISYLKIYLFLKSKTTTSVASCSNNDLVRKQPFCQHKSLRTQFFVFVAYLIMYFPFGITCLFSKETFPEYFHSMAIYLAFANSCINSILYGVFNNNIRKKYWKCLEMFTRRRSKVHTSATPIVQHAMTVHVV